MDKPRVLVVFKAEDLPHMETLLSWDTNKEYDFVYETTLPRTGIHTPDGKALKEELKAKIKTMTHLLCIIGKQTADNDWINFQIQQASVSGRKVIAVRLDSGFKSPNTLLNFGATWAKAFTFDAIRTAIAVGTSSSLPIAAMPAGQPDPDGFG
ncbi:MAG: TIR domain-containing protein [Methylovirgula sp.]